MKQPYVVLDQKHGFSPKYGTRMVTITFKGLKDRQLYITYVDEPNANYKNWAHIINNPDRGYVLRNLNVKQHKDKLLINADSKPIIDIESEDPDRILRQINNFWDEEDRKNGSDKTNDLFKFE